MKLFALTVLSMSRSLADGASLVAERTLSETLKGVQFEKFAAAPGYSEGPTWKNGELFFWTGTSCSKGSARVEIQDDTGS